MKKTLLSLAALATLSTFTHAQIFTENFDGSGPGISAWTVLDLDGRATDGNVSFITNGWNAIDLDGDDGRFGGPAGDFAAASTSWYSPAGASNDWLISPLINLSGSTDPRLRYSVKAQDELYPDGYELKVAPNGGNTVADFTDVLFSTTAENAHAGKPWTERVFSLSQYVGQSIRIAWINNSNDMFMLFVDDIFVEETPEDIELTIPFHESFDSTSDTRSSWTNIYVAGTANWSYGAGSTGVITTPKAGNANARFVSQSGENTPITKLVSPVINAGSTTNAYLEFYHGNPSWGGDINALKVYYRLSETSDWVELFSKTTATEVWTKEQIELPELSETMQFAFEGINNWGRSNVIDEVKVKAGSIPMTVTLPFNETFEDDSTTRAGWTQEAVVGQSYWTYAAGSTTSTLSTANNGSLNAQFVSVSGTNSPVTKLVTPVIDAGTTTDAYLDFYHANPTWAGDTNALKVYYRTSESSEWVQLFAQTSPLETWTHKQIQIPEVSSEMQFAFEGINNWGRANVIDDVQVIAGILPPPPPLPEVCGIENVSNNLENGVGNTKLYTYANDFRVNANSKIDVSALSFNLVSQSSGIEGATISILEDNNGLPGDVVYTFTAAPTTTESLGANFGFNFSKYSYNLPEIVTLENTTNTHKRYWFAVESVQTANANAYFETTTAENTSEYNIFVFNEQGVWQELTAEGVFTIEGECSEITPPPVCEQSTPSNAFENGFGNLITAEIGNDFQVEANTTFNLHKIKVNLMTTAGATSGTVKIYENNNGIPGDEIYTFSATPERQNIGTAFGFDVSTYTFTLPEALLIEAPADQTATYWIGISGLSVVTGANSYWEATSDVSNTTYRTLFNGALGWVPLTDPDFDGVFAIEGVCETLSIGDQTVDVNKLSVYPNPVTDVLYIKHKSAISNVEVYNLTGQNVLATKVKADGSVNLANLPKGVYVVNATLADGTNQTFKVVKK